MYHHSVTTINSGCGVSQTALLFMRKQAIDDCSTSSCDEELEESLFVDDELLSLSDGLSSSSDINSDTNVAI